MSKKIWSHYIPSLLGFFDQCRPSWGALQFWDGLMETLKEEDLIKTAIISLNIWNYRNRVTFSGERPDYQHLIRITESNIEDHLKVKDTNLRISRPESHQSQVSWNPPPSSSLKLNAGASWSSESGSGGVGWVIRDSVGSLILAGYKNFEMLVNSCS